MSTLRLATRNSPLALTQAHFTADVLRERAGVDIEIIEVETTGDRRTDVSLASVGGQGVFAVEIQDAVLRGAADVAVHSAKDLPSTTPEGLILAAVPERRDPRDVIVGRALAGLGPGATVATGSPRRRALLLERRPDLHVVELRGNMARRVAAAGHDGVDAVVAAAAALERLGWLDRAAEFLDPTWFIPQVGQGALALECRSDDVATRDALAAIDNSLAHDAIAAERAFLRELGAGCSIPAAAHVTVIEGLWQARGMMASFDGGRVVRAELTRGDESLVDFGARLARHLRDDLGGAELEGWSRG